MKKYMWLFGLTAVLLGALFFGMRSVREPIVTVSVKELQPQTVAKTVSCSGRVEEAGNAVLAVSTGVGVQVRATVPENRLKAVSVGQRVMVSGTAFSAERYSGTVLSIAEKAYTTPAGVTVLDAIVALDATDASLKCGLSAKVNIYVEEQEGLVVPYSSLYAAEDGTEYVYVIQEGRAVRRRVTIEEELPEGVLVSDGVSAGERIILSAEGIEDGMRVQEEGT